MNTFQIANDVLEGYINKIGKDRFDFLTTQANEQIDEIKQDEQTYLNYLEQVNASVKVDKLVLWILFMSNEDICIDYIKKFDKDFYEDIPMNDLADLLAYVVYLSQNNELDGIKYLAESKEKSVTEIDHLSFSNLLYYVTMLKKEEMNNQMEF